MIVTEEQRKEAHAFYKEALDLLNECGVPYMLGGAFAMFHYTGIYRDTKDLDIFCKPSDYPRILKYFSEKGYRTDLYDVRWLCKVYKDDYCFTSIRIGIFCLHNCSSSSLCILPNTTTSFQNGSLTSWCAVPMNNTIFRRLMKKCAGAL
jgi:hypothetical protein